MIGEWSSDSYFIDSNIWLYALIQSQDQTKHEVANQLTRLDNIFISTQVIDEVCVNLLNQQEIKDIITGFYQS
jgi:predicted nucleic acid-binding protein